MGHGHSGKRKTAFPFGEGPRSQKTGAYIINLTQAAIAFYSSCVWDDKHALKSRLGCVLFQKNYCPYPLCFLFIPVNRAKTWKN